MRILPHSSDAEKGVLASMLMDPNTIGIAVEEIGADGLAFHLPAHRTIYCRIIAMWMGSALIDFITLAEELDKHKELDSVGGTAFLTDLMTLVPSSARIEHYLAILREKQVCREVIGTCTRFCAKAYDEQDDVPGILSGLLTSVTAIGQGPTKQKSLRDYIDEKLERMDSGEPSKNQIATGFKDLDELSPVSLGDTVLISGERKSGKSVLGLNIMRHIATNGSAGVVFSLEDKANKVVDRLIGGETGVPLAKDHNSKLVGFEADKLTVGCSRLYDAKLDIFDDRFDLASIAGTLRRLKAQKAGLSVAMIDYAQLVRAGLKRRDASREQEVAEVSRTIRLLAMELNIAILLLSQLNEEGKTRESRSLEMDCTAMWQVTVDSKNANRRWIGIPFQRNGESSVGFYLTFFGSQARFEDYHEEDNERPTIESKRYRSRYSDD